MTLKLAKTPDERYFDGHRFLMEAHGMKSECQKRGKRFAKMGHEYRVVKKGNSYTLYVSAILRSEK
jgi:hypothetical protein